MPRPTTRALALIPILALVLIPPVAKAQVPPAIPINSAAAHPRLWVTSADLQKLRRKATPENPVYQQGFCAARDRALANYHSRYYPGGKPASPWPEPGNITWQSPTTEQDMLILAFASLIDPELSKRTEYARYARNLLMHVMNEVAKGFAPRLANGEDVPFRAAGFITYDRGRTYGEAWGLTVDWLQAYETENRKAILTAADKAIVRKGFMLWAAEIRKNGRAAPPSVRNHPSLIGNRWAANNYYSGQLRNLTLIALSLDPADDRPVNPARPETEVGNTLRSYLGDVIGTYIYQQYSIYGTPAEFSRDLNIPLESPDAQKVGIAGGGISPEGSLYGDSLGYIFQGLLALYTAGFQDPAKFGGQMRFIESEYWAAYVDGFLHNITPEGRVFPEQRWLGEVYQVAGYGDMLRTWVTPDLASIMGPLGVFAEIKGDRARLNTTRWVMRNVLEGGSEKFYSRMNNASYGANEPIFYFLLFDPKGPPEIDPRPALRTHFIAKRQGRLLARTDWTPGASWFQFICNWNTIDHQQADCNDFGFYRKGQWLTRAHTNYDNAGIGQTTDYHNTLSIQNVNPPGMQWFEGEIFKRGSQWVQGLNAGDPEVRLSSYKNYSFASGDATNAYNRRSSVWGKPDAGANDVEHASRSILWVKPDDLFIYDRITSRSQGKFKRFNLQLTGPANVSGKAVTQEFQNQILRIESILPEQGVLRVLPDEVLKPVAELEPTTHRLIIEDPKSPKRVRFLTVVKAFDRGTQPPGSIRIRAGTGFEGVLNGTTAVLFRIEPAGDGIIKCSIPFAHRVYVTGLEPDTNYTVRLEKQSASLSLEIQPGSGAKSDEAGVLEITAP